MNNSRNGSEDSTSNQQRTDNGKRYLGVGSARGAIALAFENGRLMAERFQCPHGIWSKKPNTECLDCARFK